MEDFPRLPSPYHASSSYTDICSSSSMENEFLGNQNFTTTHNIIRWKSGKRVDLRLLGLLESFGEIYVDRHEFFKKIFHENHEELFKKVGDALKRKKQMQKARSMSRSLSMRAINKRGTDDELRLERFKIRTPDVIVAAPDGTGAKDQGGQTQTK